MYINRFDQQSNIYIYIHRFDQQNKIYILTDLSNKVKYIY